MTDPYKGTSLTSADLEAFAKGFGFNSPVHLNDVLEGREPSALRDSRMHDRSWDNWRNRKSAAKREREAAAAALDLAQLEHQTAIFAEAQRLNEARRQERQQSSREARYRVLDRKAGSQ